MIKKLKWITVLLLAVSLCIPSVIFAGQDPAVQKAKKDVHKKESVQLAKQKAPAKTPVETNVSYEMLTASEIDDISELYQWYTANFKNYGFRFKIIGTDTYVLISAGEKPTGGYSMSIESATMVASGNVYITAKLLKPSPGMMVTQAFTYPHNLIKLDATGVKDVQCIIEEKTAGETAEVTKISISANYVKSAELFSLMQEKIKEYSRQEIEKLVEYYNNSEITNDPMIMMIAGNSLVFNLNDGGKISFTSYGSNTNVVANVQTGSDQVKTYHLICPEIAQILLSEPDENGSNNEKINISVRNVKSVELFNFDGEKIQTFKKQKIKKYVKDFNDSEIVDAPMIMMITGNKMVITLNDGSTVSFTSYGSKTNVIAKVDMKEGTYTSYHLVCPKIAKVLLKNVKSK